MRQNSWNKVNEILGIVIISVLHNLLFKKREKSYSSGFCRRCLFSLLVIGMFSWLSEVQVSTEPGTVSWMKMFSGVCVCVYIHIYMYEWLCL